MNDYQIKMYNIILKLFKKYPFGIPEKVWKQVRIIIVRNKIDGLNQDVFMNERGNFIFDSTPSVCDYYGE